MMLSEACTYIRAYVCTYFVVIVVVVVVVVDAKFDYCIIMHRSTLKRPVVNLILLTL